MGYKGRTWRKRQGRNRDKPISLDGKLEYITLFKWAKKNGVFFHHMKPALFPGVGRGLIATNQIKMADSLISVPRRLLVTRSMVRWNYFGGQSLESDISTTDLLCFFLVVERSLGSSSFWFPYIATLPEEFTTPSYFSEKELEIMPSFLSEHCGIQLRDVKKCIESSKKLVSYMSVERRQNIDLSLENVRWAWNVVNTRSVYLDSKSSLAEEGKMSCALAPLLDLLNHSCDVEVVAGYSEVTQCYEIRTRTRFKKGSQVFINYGPHCNRKLLLEYGFTLPSNIHNRIRIEPSNVYEIVSKNCPNGLSVKKYNIIAKYKLEEGYSCTYGGLSWSLITALKLLTVDDAKLGKKSLNIDDLALKAEDERLVVLLSRNILKSMLEDYNCSLARVRCGDAKEHGTTSQERVKQVVQLLTQEKEIVRNALSLLE